MSVEKGAKGFQVWWRGWLSPTHCKHKNNQGPGISTPANVPLMLELPPMLYHHPIRAGSIAF